MPTKGTTTTAVATAAAKKAAATVADAATTAAELRAVRLTLSKAERLMMEVFPLLSLQEAHQVNLVLATCCLERHDIEVFLACYRAFRRSLAPAALAEAIARSEGMSLLQTVGERLAELPPSRRSPHARRFFQHLWPRHSPNPARVALTWDLAKRRDIVRRMMFSDADRALADPDLVRVKLVCGRFLAELAVLTDDPADVDRFTSQEFFFLLGFHTCADRAQRAALAGAYCALVLHREPPSGQQCPVPGALTFRDLWAALLRGTVPDLLARGGVADRIEGLHPRFRRFMSVSCVDSDTRAWRFVHLLAHHEIIGRKDTFVRDVGFDLITLLDEDELWGFCSCPGNTRAKLAKFYRRLLARFEDPAEIDNGRQSGNFLKWCEDNYDGQINREVKVVLASVLPDPPH